MFWDEMKYLPFHFDTDEGGGGDGSSDDADDDTSDDDDDTGDEGDKDGDKEGDDDAGDGDKPKGKKDHHPPEGSKRWNKMYAKGKVADKYMRLGPPEQVEQRLQRLESIEAKLAEKQAAGEGKDKESEDLKEKRAKVRKQLREYEPLLEELEGVVHHNRQVRDSLKARAADAVIETMEEAGFEVDEDSFATMAGVLENIMEKDSRIQLIWYTNPEKAVKTAYKHYAEPFQADTERKRKAKLLKSGEKLDKLPKPHKGGGAPPGKKKAEEPQSVSEALDAMGEAMDELE